MLEAKSSMQKNPESRNIDKSEAVSLLQKKERKSTEIRKKEIVDIAWDLITQHGAGSITIKNIAQKAGISEAAIYRHYEDKHAILMALLDNFEKHIMESLDHPIKAHKNPLLKLKEIMKTHLIFTEKQQRVMFAITAESIHFNDDELRKKILRVIENYKERIKDILKDARRQGLVRKNVNLDSVSFVFFGLIEAAIIRYALTNYTVPPIEKFNTLWQVFLNGIYEAQPEI
jgi:AcrR family transcriptional regulator